MLLLGLQCQAALPRQSAGLQGLARRLQPLLVSSPCGQQQLLVALLVLQLMALPVALLVVMAALLLMTLLVLLQVLLLLVVVLVLLLVFLPLLLLVLLPVLLLVLLLLGQHEVAAQEAEVQPSVRLLRLHLCRCQCLHRAGLVRQQWQPLQEGPMQASWLRQGSAWLVMPRLLVLAWP